MTVKENKALTMKLVSILVAVLIGIIGWTGKTVYGNLVEADKANHDDISELEAEFEDKIDIMNEHLIRIDTSLTRNQLVDKLGTELILKRLDELEEALKK